MRARLPYGLSLLVGALWVLLVGCQSDDAPPPTGASRLADTGGCALPALTCDGVCRDLTSDRVHCGACGRACAAGEVCSRGACAASCGAGLTRCATSGSCHDLRSDPAHCGACDRPCGFGEVCDQGVCARACAPHLTACGMGACRDVMTDPGNCGACGRVCAAGEVCTSGACALPSVCALGTASNTTAVVDQSELVSSTSSAARVGTALTTGAAQRFTVARTGFLSGVEVSLTTCGGALLSGSTVQLALFDEAGQPLATATLPNTAVTNGTCPRFPPSLTATTRGRAVFDLSAACVPVTAGRRLRFVVTSAGALTNGTCPNATRRCSNAPERPCATSSDCANLPAVVSAGLNPLSVYAGGGHDVGGAAVPGASLTFKTYVTPFVTWCAGEAACNGTCRDLTSDRNHCGACGRSCSSSLVCSSGVCQASCGAGLTACTRGTVIACANLQSDNVDCGACGNACAPGQVCAAGQCVTTCGAGMTTCGRGPTAYCARTATDNANCGRCGVVCPAGQVCSAGACAVTCAAPTTRCGDACADTRYDPANCGACGSACPAGQVCAGGVCGASCGDGLTACGARCADVQNDPMNCGACGRACPAGQLCAAGACGVACGAGAVRCDLGAGPYCAAPLTDNANCGGCGVRCGAGNACVDGACAVTCGPGLTACDERCVDARHDPTNCGACGRSCAAGQYCTMGACAAACAAPDTQCGGRCVDLRSNPDHCGACGSACPPAGAGAVRACGEATCGTFCAPGLGDCDGAAGNGCETDLRATAAHCGLCGRRCALPHTTASGCAMGACTVTTCEAGWVDCNGDPSDGCELQEGGACPFPDLCFTGRLNCFEGRPACWVDAVLPAGTPCRGAAAPCDAPEFCDGLNPLCPTDSVVPTAQCPSALVGSGTATAAGECLATYSFVVEPGVTYTVSTCDAFTGDPWLRVDGDCTCQNDDACGLGARCSCTARTWGTATICASTYANQPSTWRYTVTSSNGRCGGPTVCRAAAGACDADEVCDGVSGACPADARAADGVACDDGDACTHGDVCMAGACRPGAPPTCAEGACGGATCDRSTGRCVAKADGTTCDDGDALTHGDQCFAGRCGGASAATGQQVAAGYGHSLVRASDGRVWAFGHDLQRADEASAEGRRVSGLVAGVGDALHVAAGTDFALAVQASGRVVAWGDNSAGQLGDGTTARRTTPVEVMGLTGVVRVAAGAAHGLALTSDGSLFTWGSDASGQLGQSDPGTRLTPARVPYVNAVSAVAAGAHHSLVVRTDGTVWAWGDNTEGQLGDGSTTSRRVPAQVGGLPTVIAVAAGGMHSLALTSDGAVWAWGANDAGQLGDGTTTRRLTPQRVASLTGVAQLAAGWRHSLARRADGTLWGWGEGASGQLAVGPTPGFSGTAPHPTPARVGALDTVADIAAGAEHSLVATADGRVWAFGSNGLGELGDDTVADVRARVEPVVGFGRYALNVLTQRYDTLRAGANLREAALTSSNVRPSTFGRLFEATVQGDVLAQPLFVQGAIDGRDVVYVATLDNYVYAIDAVDGRVHWSRQVGRPLRRERHYWCGDLRGNIGIVSTPVVDLSRRALYFTAKSVPTAAAGAPEPMPEYHLHAVDLVTGADRAGSPVRIEAAVPGDARIAPRSPPDPWSSDPRFSTGNRAGMIHFDALYQLQRPGLLLQDGQVFITFGGHCDLAPYHGWLLTYDAGTLAQTGAMVTTPTGDTVPTVVGTVRWDNVPTAAGAATGELRNGLVEGYGQGGAIWQYGNGPASTGTGDVFVTLGNSMGVREPTDLMASFAGGPASSLTSFSNAALRVGRRADGSLGVMGWFQPDDWRQRDLEDDDLGSAGPLLVPGTDRVLVTGKGRRIYLLRRSALGGYSVGNPGAVNVFNLPGTGYDGVVMGGGVWWQSPVGGRFYVWPYGGGLRSFSIDGDVIRDEGTDVSGSFGVDRSTITLSANGPGPGSGVVWSFVPNCRSGAGLMAWDASNIAAGPIYSSSQALADQLPASDRSPPITVARGRVYVGTLANRLVAYGLLPAPRSVGSVSAANACARSCPPSSGAYTGPLTWSALYAQFFAGTTTTATSGHCTMCHGAWSTANAMYDGWVSSGILNTLTPSASSVVSPTASILRWVNPTGGRMPAQVNAADSPDLCNPAAVDALQRWIAAGAPR